MIKTRNVIVTAGSGAIGRAVCEWFMAQGDQVWSLDSVASVQGNDVTSLECDLLHMDSIQAVLADLPGEVDVLVNVMGGERRPALEEVTDTAWPPVSVFEDIFDWNVGAPYRVVNALNSRLSPNSSICGITSIAAALPWTVSPAYGAAKAAVEHWYRTLAVMLASRNIRVNFVRPGFVWSPQWAAVDRDEFNRVAASRSLLGALEGNGDMVGQLPSDIASAVGFLCGDQSRHLTGQALNVDGGAVLGNSPR